MMRVTERVTGGAERLTRSGSRSRNDRAGERFEERLDSAEREDEGSEREEREVSDNSLPPGWGFGQAPPTAKLDGGAQQQEAAQPPLLNTGFSWTSAHEAIAPLAVSTQSAAAKDNSTSFQAADIKAPEAPAPTVVAEANTAKEPAAPAPVVRTEVVTPARAAMAIQEVIPRLELLEEGKVLRVAIDRDLSLEVAWAEDGIEVRMDGTPEAVAAVRDIGAELADLLSQSGTDLLDFSTHERDEESTEHLKSDDASPDEDIEAQAAPIEMGNLVNVIV
jgi:hypothetical protein